MQYTDEEIGTFFAAAETWGEVAQWLMVLEETSELSVLITQSMRGRDVQLNDLAEEIADCLIMLGQAACMVGLNEVDIRFKEKLARLQHRLEGADE